MSQVNLDSGTGKPRFLRKWIGSRREDLLLLGNPRVANNLAFELSTPLRCNICVLPDHVLLW